MSFIRIVFCAFLIVLMACSDEPIRTGPFHEEYHCDLNGIVYTNISVYDYYCNEEHVNLYETDLSIMNSIMNDVFIHKNCFLNKNKIRFISDTGEKNEHYRITVSIDSVGFLIISGANSYKSYHIERCMEDVCNEYECSDSLDSEKIAVLKEPDCNDTLAIKSIIDFFKEVPDYKCEEFHIVTAR